MTPGVVAAATPLSHPGSEDLPAVDPPTVDLPGADLLDQLVDHAFTTLDPQGRVASWSAGAERLTGYTAAEAIGRHFSTSYPEDYRRDGLPEQVLERARTEGSVDLSGWRVRRDGTRFWADASVTALRAGDGRLLGYAGVTRDLTRQHELETSLRTSEERLRLLVEQVVDYAIVGLDPTGVIESWNSGAQRVKGYTAQEAIGHSFEMFYSDFDRRSGLPLQLLDRARADGSVEHTGWRIRKDGTRFWGDITITALHDDDGRPVGFVKVTRDLTDSKRLEEAQQSFISAFAHDFRMPLTALRGYTELLRDAPPERIEEFLTRIEDNAQRLMAMLQELTGYASVRRLQQPMRLEQLDVADAVWECVAGLASVVDVHRLRLPEPGTLVLADRGALQRILTNLVTNAVKYSAESPVTIGVDRRGDRTRIVVADLGRGIAPEDLAAVFDEYERGRLAEADGGTGLGLASVRQLVLQQGGRVWVDSEVGVGTTVTVELPAPA